MHRQPSACKCHSCNSDVRITSSLTPRVPSGGAPWGDTLRAYVARVLSTLHMSHREAPRIRAARPADASRVLALAIRDSVAGACSSMPQASPAEIASYLELAARIGLYPVSRPDGVSVVPCSYFVLDHPNDGVIGFALGAYEPERSTPARHVVELLMVSVAARHYGSRYGRLLAQRAMDHAVHRFGRSTQFYARVTALTGFGDTLLRELGFALHGQRSENVREYVR